MKIHYPDGCEQEWRESLTDWQRETLVAIHRQGKHLTDRTNHGNDMRWAQAGCRTRDSFGTWRRTSRTDRHAHEAVIIHKQPFGYTVNAIRRTQVFLLDPETGETQSVEGWQAVDRWHVASNHSANHITDRMREAA